MSKEGLLEMLVSDLRAIRLPMDEVSFELRGYSKAYWGRYFPAWRYDAPRVFIYPYRDQGERWFLPYGTLLSKSIHEMCHHLQYTSSGHVFRKGRMHDEGFWRLYNIYTGIARRKGLLGDGALSGSKVG